MNESNIAKLGISECLSLLAYLDGDKTVIHTGLLSLALIESIESDDIREVRGEIASRLEMLESARDRAYELQVAGKYRMAVGAYNSYFRMLGRDARADELARKHKVECQNHLRQIKKRRVAAVIFMLVLIGAGVVVDQILFKEDIEAFEVALCSKKLNSATEISKKIGWRFPVKQPLRQLNAYYVEKRSVEDIYSGEGGQVLLKYSGKDLLNAKAMVQLSSEYEDPAISVERLRKAKRILQDNLAKIRILDQRQPELEELLNNLDRDWLERLAPRFLDDFLLQVENLHEHDTLDSLINKYDQAMVALELAKSCAADRESNEIIMMEALRLCRKMRSQMALFNPVENYPEKWELILSSIAKADKLALNHSRYPEAADGYRLAERQLKDMLRYIQEVLGQSALIAREVYKSKRNSMRDELAVKYAPEEWIDVHSLAENAELYLGRPDGFAKAEDRYRRAIRKLDKILLRIQDVEGNHSAMLAAKADYMTNKNVFMERYDTDYVAREWTTIVSNEQKVDKESMNRSLDSRTAAKYRRLVSLLKSIESRLKPLKKSRSEFEGLYNSNKSRFGDFSEFAWGDWLACLREKKRAEEARTPEVATKFYQRAHDRLLLCLDWQATKEAYTLVRTDFVKRKRDYPPGSRSIMATFKEWNTLLVKEGFGEKNKSEAGIQAYRSALQIFDELEALVELYGLRSEVIRCVAKGYRFNGNSIAYVDDRIETAVGNRTVSKSMKELLDEIESLMKKNKRGFWDRVIKSPLSL